MEANQISSYSGKCRCCLKKGNHLIDLNKQYNVGGITEVYSDIFVDCFNLFLSADARITTLICTSCVLQLKNASHFKTKVLASEKLLLESLNLGSDKVAVYLNNNDENHVIDEVKEEIYFKDETDNDLVTSLLNCEPECIDECEELDFREKLILNRFCPGRLQMLPTRLNLRTVCSGYFQELDKLKGKKITAKMLKNLLAESVDTKATPKIALEQGSSLRSEKMGHITNIVTLLTYSNLTAFKTKYKNGFPCFYCSALFENLQLLRTHQESHGKNNLDVLVKKKYRPGRPDCLVVYAEVTDLKCTICDNNVKSLQALKSHLTRVHEKTMHLQYTDRVIPFKISGDGYQCQICYFFFETFGAIEKHMNTHFRNFVCEECGAGFISRNRLKVHTYNLHRKIGKFTCEACKKTFLTRNKLKIHFSHIHKLLKKIKCPKCPARFAQYVTCQKHLVDVHGVTPIKYKCNVCDKAFSRRFHLTRHIKKNHL